jgi:hypothetical protein
MRLVEALSYRGLAVSPRKAGGRCASRADWTPNGYAMTVPAGCVRLRPGVPVSVIERAGLEIVNQLHFASDLYYVAAPDVDQLKDAFVRLADSTIYTEPEQPLAIFVPPMSLSAFDQGCAEIGVQPYLDRMGITTAWKRATGRNISIGVIDGDFDAASKELAKAWDPHRSAFFRLDSCGRPLLETLNTRQYPAVKYEHGTRCAALAVAATNDLNGTGAAPDSTLVPVGIGDLVSPIMAARALAYCADPSSESGGSRQKGCTVISCSVTPHLVRGGKSYVVRDALAFLDHRDVLLVSAVANAEATEPPDFVALHPTVLATASVNASFQRGVNPGPTWADLCVAQTLGVCGTTIDDKWVPLRGGNSWSAPVIAGIAALVRQAHPRMRAVDVRKRILDTCEQVADPSLVGRGLVRADEAIK